MNLQKLLFLALLASAISATTAPTISKVLGFGHHSVALAADADDDNPGDESNEDGDNQ
jgi:hypothetical protein